VNVNNKTILLDIGSANPRLDSGWELVDDLEVIMFEPDERSFNQIDTSSYSFSCKVFNYALNENDGLQKLYLTRKPELTSFYKPNKTLLRRYPDKNRWDIIGEIQVEAKSLKTIKHEIGDFDFIKLDTQGSELAILRGAIGGGLETTLGIECEVEFIELYAGQPLFGDVAKSLKLQGFEFFDFVVEYRYGRLELNRRGQLSFADALFLRTPEWVIESFKSGVIDKRKINAYFNICKVYCKEDLIEVVREELFGL